MNRNKEIDIIKGIAILLMVYGHAIQYSTLASSDILFNDKIFKLIYTFHMPLFMIISGFLCYQSFRKYSEVELVLSRAKSLLIPVAVWSLIPYIKLMNDIEVGILMGIKKYLGVVVREFWFLWAVFWCTFLVGIVRRYCKDKIICYLIIFISMFFIPDVYNFHLYKFMFPFFVIGYLYHKKYHGQDIGVFFSLEKKSEIIGILILGALYLVMYYIFDENMYIYASGFSILGKEWGEQIYINLFRTIIGLTGSILVVYIFRKLHTVWGERINTTLSYIGRQSLGVYVLSSNYFLYLNSLLVKKEEGINYIKPIVETIIIVTAALGIIKIMAKIPYLGKILLGER